MDFKELKQLITKVDNINKEYQDELTSSVLSKANETLAKLLREKAVAINTWHTALFTLDEAREFIHRYETTLKRINRIQYERERLVNTKEPDYRDSLERYCNKILKELDR